MARQASRNPTELELEILQQLWQDAPISGRQIRNGLEHQGRGLSYQAVMTVLGIMDQKGYVARNKDGGVFLYRARVTEKATSKRMLKDLVQRLFHGSVSAAMLNLLETSDLSDDEIAQLRQSVNRRKQE